MAKKICEQFIVHQIRERDEIQHQPIAGNGKDFIPKVQEVIRLLENNINEPLTITEIGQYLNLQSRTFERLFKIHSDCGPKGILFKTSFNTHAQNLLKQSTLSVSNVALACGFSNASSFNKAYKNLFNYSPKCERNILDLAS